MASASCGRSALNSCTKASKRACCCRLFMPGGRVASFFRVRCMRSWRPFCCGWPGLMRSMAMPSRSHQTESLERLNRALGLAKGTPLSERMACGQAALEEELLEGGDGEVLAGRFEGLAEQQEARGVVGDGERVAVAAVAELELALEVGAPQVVGRGAGDSGVPVARWRGRPGALDQAVAVRARHGWCSWPGCARRRPAAGPGARGSCARPNAASRA